MGSSSAEEIVSIGLAALESLDPKRLAWMNEVLPFVAFTSYRIGQWSGPLFILDAPARFEPALVLSVRIDGESFMFACSEAWLDMLLGPLDVNWGGLSDTVRRLLVQKAIGPMNETFTGLQMASAAQWGQADNANELFFAAGEEAESWFGFQCASSMRAEKLFSLFSQHRLSREVSPLATMPISLPLVAARLVIPAADLQALAPGDVLPC